MAARYTARMKYWGGGVYKRYSPTRISSHHNYITQLHHHTYSHTHTHTRTHLHTHTHPHTHHKATNKEKKTLARDMYEDFSKISMSLKIRGDKLTDVLKKVGLTEDEYWQVKARLDQDEAEGAQTSAR